MSEHQEQVNVIAWARMQECVYPELCLLFAVINGAALTWHRDRRGRRYSPQAAKLKAEGMLPGIPDLVLPVARRGYGCLLIEMKAPGGKLSDDQAVMINCLRQSGNRAVVCYSAEEAINEIEWYLGG
jgi:hypothetical protein